jgi:hypothetical protein
MARTLLFDARFAGRALAEIRQPGLKGTTGPFGENFSRKGFVPCQGTPFNLKTVTWGEVPTAFLSCPTAKVCDGKDKVW